MKEIFHLPLKKKKKKKNIDWKLNFLMSSNDAFTFLCFVLFPTPFFRKNLEV